MAQLKLSVTKQAETSNLPATEERLRIGLTGGIASGKSAVSHRLGELGAGIVDTDEIAREVVAPGTSGLAQIIASFGSELLLEDGTLDRTSLRQRVFSNPADKSRLEAILHPQIRKLALERAATTSGDYLVFVVPLLFETDFAQLVDRVLVVDCPTELQQERLMQRDKEPPESALRLISSQIDRAERVALADDVIVNSGSLADLDRAVKDIHQQYLELARHSA